MKRLLLLLLFCSSFAQAAVTTFSWDPSPGAVGYRLWCGPTTGSYLTLTTPPVFDLIGQPLMTSFTVQTFAPGTYFCGLKAYTPAAAICTPVTTATPNCSPFSNEVTFTVAQPNLTPPMNLKVIITVAFDQAQNMYVAKVEVSPPETHVITAP